MYSPVDQVTRRVCIYIHLLVPSTPVLQHWHMKDPGHSAKSAGGRLHLNMHTPLTQQSQSGLTMLLSRHSVGTYQKRAHMHLVREHLATVVSAH